MGKVFKWIGRVLGGLLGLLLLAVAALLVAAWIADPAVPRNLLFGQSLSRPAAVEDSQPQEVVPGRPRDDITIGAQVTLDPRGLALAETYADKMKSVALLVFHRGALRYEKYWPGYGAATRTNPNSMHKGVLALVVGAAIADGYIDSVDAPASRWITEWQGDARRDITLRELLQMRSGLEVPIFGTWKSSRILFGSDLMAGVSGLGVAAPHGTEFQYNNASSQLLLTVVERATGKRYAEYLSARIWQRLGASDAALWMDRVGGQPRGFCCLFATARDWLRVGRLILDRGRAGEDQVLPAAWIDAMTTPSPRNPNFGMQVWLGSPPGTERPYNRHTVKAFHSRPFAAPDIIYLDGFGGQRVYIIPSLELVIVRTGVSSTEWDDAILPNAIIGAVRR
jgi:CubicO group peptidase (beta-lactamase class C family)